MTIEGNYKFNIVLIIYKGLRVGMFSYQKTNKNKQTKLMLQFCQNQVSAYLENWGILGE